MHQDCHAAAGENGLNDLVDILMDGISRVRNGAPPETQIEYMNNRRIYSASPAGDPRLRIEKYFSAVVSFEVRIAPVGNWLTAGSVLD